MSDYGPHLLAHHADMLRDSAISPEVAHQRGYRSATQRAELEELGFCGYQALVPALVLPIRDANGAIAFHQIRPDSPRMTENGREVKYETPKGTRLCIDVPPSVREQLRDPKVLLWITEGARKVDAAVSAGLCCIGLLGVYGWRGTNEEGGKTALACWDSIALNGRETIIAYDSDIVTKKAVNLACMALKRFLKQRGAAVRLLYLPEGEGGKKVGLDDFIAAGASVADLRACIERPQKPQDVEEKAPTKRDKEVNELVEFVIGQLAPFPYEGTTPLLFHTAAGEPYAVIAPSNTLQTVAVRSTAFRNYLASSFYAQKKRAPSREALAQARYVLEGKAQFDGPEVEVYTRIAQGPDGAVYIDLGDSRCRAIRVDAAGWNLVARPPVRFRRAAGMLALPVPERGGSLDELRPFVNVRRDDDDGDFALFVGSLVAAFRPQGPYLVLVHQGEQGSAKSTVARVWRRLIDPNKAELRSQPKEPRDLAIAANNAWCICLDNLSRIQPWLSDGLCRLATGGGFATRALYTDAEESIFDAQRPILLNGIDSVATRGDLLDRSILLTLPRVERYREESEFWAEFEEVRPRILGALLDAVSVALRREAGTQLTVSVRMADAARWVVAAEPALPWSRGTFIKAYAANRADANTLALETSPFAIELQAFVRERMGFEGTAKELLEGIERSVKDSTRKLQSWPKTPRGVSGALRRLAPNLRGLGFKVEFPPRESSRRPIVIEPPEISAGEEPVEEGNDRHNRHDRHAHQEMPDAEGGYGSAADDGRGDDSGGGEDRPSSDPYGGSARNPNGNDDCDGHDGSIPSPGASPDPDGAEIF